MADRDARAQLQGFSLTTAEILYRLPDHPSLLQTYVWQEYDLHPRFPRLMAFLGFWTANLEGRLFRITVAHKALISPRELRIATGDFHLN
ncbi:MAG: protein usg [Hyphomicrobium sp.]|nr:protein usg [Hyphomicrobium sp.]ODT27912.1 MAG: protein usg [Hyphomicrobium sp. SCN 65-11]